MFMIWYLPPNTPATEAMAFLTRMAGDDEENAELRARYRRAAVETMNEEGVSERAQQILLEESKEELIDALAEGGLDKVPQ